MMIKQRLFWIVGLLAAYGIARADSLSAGRRCVAIVARDARLACFDAAFAATDTGASSTAPPASAAPPSRPQPSASFGEVRRPVAEKPVDNVPRTLTAAVTAVAARPGDLYRLTLDNGEVWDTREPDRTANYRPGDKVTIRHTPTGGYLLYGATGARSVGARRVE